MISSERRRASQSGRPSGIRARLYQRPRLSIRSLTRTRKSRSEARLGALYRDGSCAPLPSSSQMQTGQMSYSPRWERVRNPQQGQASSGGSLPTTATGRPIQAAKCVSRASFETPEGPPRRNAAAGTPAPPRRTHCRRARAGQTSHPDSPQTDGPPARLSTAVTGDPPPTRPMQPTFQRYAFPLPHIPHNPSESRHPKTPSRPMATATDNEKPRACPGSRHTRLFKGLTCASCARTAPASALPARNRGPPRSCAAAPRSRGFQIQ